jgi:hypothetical protein
MGGCRGCEKGDGDEGCRSRGQTGNGIKSKQITQLNQGKRSKRRELSGAGASEGGDWKRKKD